MEVIKVIRNILGLTQEEFAKELGVSLSLYEKIEYGYIKPSKNVIEKLKNKYPFIDTNVFFEK